MPGPVVAGEPLPACPDADDVLRVARDLLAKGYKHLAVEEWRAGDRLKALGTTLRAVRTSPGGIALSVLPGRRTLPSVSKARAALSG